MSDSKIPRKLREQLIIASRRMRKEPTKAEALLWEHLRFKQLGGLKFRRQHILYAYIVDFYCPSAKVAIELDGAIHERQQEYDRERVLDLAAMGIRVVRFANEEVFEDMDKVLETILSNCIKRESKKK